jgi:hypothetical protein
MTTHFRVYHAYQPDGWEVEAQDADEAAEMYAEWFEAQVQDFRCLTAGAKINVMVRDYSGRRIQFSVTGESMPQYFAEEVLE